MAKLRVKSVGEKAAPEASVLAEFGDLEDRIRKRAWDLFAHRGFGPSGPLDDWLTAERQVCGAAAELTERKDKYVLKVALAGYEPENVDVAATPNELFVKANFDVRKEKKSEGKGEVVHWSEFQSGNVYRHIDLPRTIDTDRVEAMLKGGILTVEAPWKKTKDTAAKQTRPKKTAKQASSRKTSTRKSSKKKASKKRTSSRKTGKT